MATPILESKRVHDLILAEWDQRYSRIEATLIGVGAAGVQNFVVGQILKTASANYTPAVAGDTTGVHAVLLANVSVLDDATVKVPILVRGPVIVNQDELVSPATTNLAAQVAAIALLGIVMVREPTMQTTGGA